MKATTARVNTEELQRLRDIRDAAEAYYNAVRIVRDSRGAIATMHAALNLFALLENDKMARN